MAICMAREMRSGTLVGPGTNKKLRPGFLAPAIQTPPIGFLGRTGGRPGFAWEKVGNVSFAALQPLSRLEKACNAAIGGKLDIVGSWDLGKSPHGPDVPPQPPHPLRPRGKPPPAG